MHALARCIDEEASHGLHHFIGLRTNLYALRFKQNLMQFHSDLWSFFMLRTANELSKIPKEALVYTRCERVCKQMYDSQMHSYAV